MFCHFDVTLEKALGLSAAQPQLSSWGSPGRALQAEMVPVGEVMAALLRVEQEAGSLR